MSDMLDDIPDDGLRKRLQDYSESPDEGQWEKIASGVRERMPLGTRLETYREEPDPFVWTKVNQGLAIERSVMWLERAGKISTVIAYLLLLFPLIQLQIHAEHHPNVISGKEMLATERAAGNELSLQPAEDTLPETVFRDDENSQSPIGGSSLAEKPGRSVTNSENAQSGQPMSDGHPEGPQKSSIGLSHVTIPNSPAVDAPDSSIVSINSTAASAVRNETQNNSEVAGKAITVTGPSQTKVDSSQTFNLNPVIVSKQGKGQETAEEKKANKKRHYDLYALVMPTFGYQQISPVKDDNIIIESIEKVSTFSAKRLGVRAEVGMEKKFYHKFSYHLGLVYFQRKQTIQYHYRDSHETQIHKIDSYSLTYQVSSPQDTATFSYQLKNVGVVLGINYTTKVKRFVHKVGLAGELHKGLSVVNREIDNGQRYYVFGDVYYRLSYPVSSRVEVMLQPTVNYALQIDERINAPFYVKPYGLGLNFGVYFHF